MLGDPQQYEILSRNAGFCAWNGVILGYGNGEGQEAGVQSSEFIWVFGLLISSIWAKIVSWWPKGPSYLGAHISTVERSDWPTVLSIGAASSGILCNLRLHKFYTLWFFCLFVGFYFNEKYNSVVFLMKKKRISQLLELEDFKFFYLHGFHRVSQA